jgi:hypothetical protein
MDFTRKYNNFFAQALASHVDDPTSIVVFYQHLMLHNGNLPWMLNINP